MKKWGASEYIITAVIIILVVLIIYSSTRMKRPVPGEITSRFGMRMHPTLHTWKMHEGVDMTGALGTDIVNPKGGKVIARRYNDIGGNELVLDHGNGLTTGYSHLSAFSVNLGDYVRKGQKLGEVGATGRATGPHLHFSVKKDGKFVNPENYI